MYTQQQWIYIICVSAASRLCIGRWSPAVRGQPSGSPVSSARSDGSRCCLKACHFNQGCCSAVVVFWGTWQRLLSRGCMWFAMPVIGFDFAFCTFCLCLIKGFCHWAQTQKHSWVNDWHGAQSQGLWWLAVWGKWGKLISVGIFHFTISVSPSLGIISCCVQALFTTYCFQAVCYYPAANSTSNAGCGWCDEHAELYRLCPSPTGSHDQAICLAGKQCRQSISVVPFTDWWQVMAGAKPTGTRLSAGLVSYFCWCLEGKWRSGLMWTRVGCVKWEKNCKNHDKSEFFVHIYFALMFN